MRKSYTIQNFSRIVAAVFLAVGTTAITATYGQTQTTLPNQVVGTWTKNTPQGANTKVETFTFSNTGFFQYLKTSTFSAPGCTLTLAFSSTGSATVKTASTLAVPITGAGFTRKAGNCGFGFSPSNPPPPTGTLTWSRKNDNQGQKLCLQGTIQDYKRTSNQPQIIRFTFSTIRINGCYTRKA